MSVFIHSMRVYGALDNRGPAVDEVFVFMEGTPKGTQIKPKGLRKKCKPEVCLEALL